MGPVIERAIADAFPGGLTEAERCAYSSVGPWETLSEKLLRGALDSHWSGSAAGRQAGMEASMRGMSPTERLQYKAQLERGWTAGDRVSRYY